MIKRIILGFLLMAAAVTAQAGEVQIYLPGLQYRFEDDQEQVQLNRRYTNVNIAATIFQDYLIGLEYDRFTQDSGNASLNTDYDFQEFNLYAGYYFWSRLLFTEYKIAAEIGPVGYLGTNSAVVETRLAGAPSVRSQGENNLVLGLGLQGTLRFNYVLLQADGRFATSRSYAPAYTPVYGIRFGFRIGY